MSLTRQLAVMRNAPLLRALSEDALKMLAFNSEVLTLKPRQTLFKAGEVASGAVLVLAGRLTLVPPNPATEPSIAHVGDLVDELALITQTTRGATAVTQATCEVLLLPRSQMLRILEEYPEAAVNLERIVAQRVGAFFQDVAALGKESAGN